MCTSTHGRSNIHDLFLLIKFFSISLKNVSMATNCVRLNLKKQTPEFPFLIKISTFCWFEQMLNLIVSIKIVIRLWSWYKLIQVGTSRTSLRASSVGKHLLPSPAPRAPKKACSQSKANQAILTGNIQLNFVHFFVLFFCFSVWWDIHLLRSDEQSWILAMVMANSREKVS